MYGRERQYVLSEKIVQDSVKRLQQSNIKNSRYRPQTLNSVILILFICFKKNEFIDYFELLDLELEIEFLLSWDRV